MKALRPLYAFLFLWFVAVAFVACDDTSDGSYVEPITLYEKVSGNWIISDVRMMDEAPASTPGATTEISLKDQFQFLTFGMMLNVDGINPTSYQVNGTSPELFPKSGFWKLDVAYQAADGSSPKVLLYADEAKTKEIGYLTVSSVPGAQDVMDLKFTRTTKGVPYVSYVYKLTK